ncbi:DNA sulfur modification protein DndB [Vibrio splendidus]
MSNLTLLPAIRSRVGDWIFYSASISFSNINQLIKSPDEIHERKGLADWIQREAIDTHADAISNYIQSNEQRFLGALVIGVYEGDPNWIPLDVNFSSELVDIPEDSIEYLSGKLGLLKLTGSEKLFAIDGQHRVAGIKKALESEVKIFSDSDEEITAIFVSHNGSSDEGKQRTRRLFTTLNKKAKRISKAAEIALDEDNGFAIVTRMLIDSHWLFEDERGHISYTSTGSIKAEELNTITSVVGLHEIVKDLFVGVKKEFENHRPTDRLLESHLSTCTNFLDYLLKYSKEFKSVFIDRSKPASFYRTEENNLLFRPVGQRAFAKSVLTLVSRGHELESAISTLIKANLDISSNDWHNILWDPVDSTMIVNKVAIAESQLLTLCGHEPQSKRKKEALEELINSRGY